MNTREIRQLTIAVHRDYVPHIHREGLSEHDQEVALLSRGLAAMAVGMLTGWNHRQSGITVIDGYGDNGIDAIAADKQQKCIFLIQSKWRATGNKTLSAGDAHKFIEGLRSLLLRKFERFDDRVQALRPNIEDILQLPGSRIVLVVATTVNHELSPGVRSILDDEIVKNNRIEELVSLRYLRLSDFHRVAVENLEQRGPTVAANFMEWGLLAEPYKALHGRICATELGNWYVAHGDRLFESNVRREIADSPVNRCIVRALVEEPDNFWYFNNGVTVLCRDWPQAPAWGAGDKPVRFSFTDVSIVNGAQTVTSIHHAMRRDPEAVRKAQVSVRFIALKDCPDGFGSRVTYATNFQNSVDSRDFLALDPHQKRLRRDFQLNLGKEYVLRKGDPVPGSSAGCSVVDAAIALACAHPDVQLAVMAKNRIEELWKSTETTPYRDLFHSRTSAIEVWGEVQVVRAVDEVMRSNSALGEGLTKEIAVEGNRIIAHLVFRLLDNVGIEDADLDWENRLAEIKGLASKVLSRLSVFVDAEVGERGSVRRLFDNVVKCRKLVELVCVDFDGTTGLLDGHDVPAEKLRDGIREPEFLLQGRLGTVARGYRFGQDRFLVLKDSLAANTAVQSLYPRYDRRRKQLIDESVLSPTADGMHLVLKQDVLFDSPSDAGTVMTGCSINGRQKWRTIKGLSIAQLEQIQEGPSVNDERDH